MDTLTPAQRHKCMSRVAGVNTSPEIIVRKVLHRLGYRFRIHVRQLPGKPDIVLVRHRKIILVNGCFWHGHRRCPRASRPTSNREFWDKKLDATISRDRRIQRELRGLGWRVLVVWQCQIHKGNIEQRLRKFMEIP